MCRDVTTRGPVFPPVWASVLAVVAHPDDESCGLGAILDAFFYAGTRVGVVCLTHGQVWTLDGAPGDLAALRGAGLASAADVLGPHRAKMQDCPDGDLGNECQNKLASEVVAAAESSHPDGLLVFDTVAAPGHLDHVAATSAGLLGAEKLDLPVLGWTFPTSVAVQLIAEFGASAVANRDVDLRVTLDRARQRWAGHAHQSQAQPGSVRRRRLELLADAHSLRWMRPPRALVGGSPARPAEPGTQTPTA